MRWLIELSGEHPSLPKAEAIAGFESVGASPHNIEQDGLLLTFMADAKPELIAHRLAMSHYVNEEIVAGSFEDIASAAEKIDLAGNKFMVRAYTKGESPTVEKKIGKFLAGTGTVDLKRPDIVFKVHKGRTWHFSKVLCKVGRNNFEKRRVIKRPYVKPISLHPRLARTLVNLTQVQWGQTLLDPFCGTGGILLEAALVGAQVIGSDIDTDMIAGTMKTMKHYGHMTRLIRADVGELPKIIDSVDAIATDPPYGRSSSTKKEPIESLYIRAFETFEKLLKEKGRLAICLPEKKYAELAGPKLILQEEHEVFVHRSLKRHFIVFSKEP